MTAIEMTLRFSAEQDILCKKLRKEVKKINCFEYEGVYFRGDYFDAVVEFVHNNPTGGDFYVYLQKHWKIIGHVK